jgi:hypothetical protein
MATASNLVMTEDVWRQIGELVRVDLGKCRGATIHLEAGEPVRVDLLGVIPKQQDGMVDVTTLADKFQRLSQVETDERLMEPIATSKWLNVRIRKACIRRGCHTIGDLIRKHPDDLLEARGFGGKCLHDLRQALRDQGIEWIADK